MFRISAAFISLFLAAAFAADGNGPLILRSPTLSKTQIAFVFAGDLWVVPREGGDASRLTAGPGTETNPQFSPDGRQIAFTGEYDGNVDVYVVAASGGVPKRLTWHPSADTVLGWSPDGKKILFASNRTSYSRFSKLFTVSLEGGLEEELPLPMGFEGAYSADGAPKPLATETLEVQISPREEWRQMYREVWRLERDFFYDPNFHGLDLKAAEWPISTCLILPSAATPTSTAISMRRSARKRRS
jgi:dipeptidyl aminopeptidase/acylaminoacyl peptidase